VHHILLLAVRAEQRQPQNGSSGVLWGRQNRDDGVARVPAKQSTVKVIISKLWKFWSSSSGPRSIYSDSKSKLSLLLQSLYLPNSNFSHQLLSKCSLPSSLYHYWPVPLSHRLSPDEKCTLTLKTSRSTSLVTLPSDECSRTPLRKSRGLTKSSC
jgi:hypothetical protein